MHVRRSVLIVMALSCAAAADLATLSGRPVAFVGVRGAGDPARVRSLLGVGRGDPFDSAAAAAGLSRVLDGYRASGRFLASVSLDGYALRSRGDSAAIVVTVIEGPPATFGGIAVHGDSSLPGGASQYVSARAGDEWSASALESDVAAILGAYDRVGFPFAQVVPEVESISDDGAIDVALLVAEGPRVAVSGVGFPGRARARHEVYAREFHRAIGREYDSRLMDEGARRLRKLPGVREVGEPSVLLRADDASVLVEIPIVEGNASRAEGVLGYSPDGELAGLVDVSFGNIYGTGRRAAFGWSRPGGGDEDLSFSYREPWIFAHPFDAVFSFASSRRDSLYNRTSVSVALVFDVAEGLSGGFAGAWSRIAPDEQDVPSVDPARRLSAAVHGGFTTFDQEHNPSRGFSVSARAEYARRRSWPPEGERGANEAVLSGWSAVALPLKLPHLLYVRVDAGAARSSDDLVPVDLRFRLGGRNTLRGYPEERFSAVSAVWGRFEYRLRVDSRSYVAAFVDGAAWRDQTATENGVLARDDAKAGLGFGLSTGAGDYIASLDYAWGERATIANGVVHVSLTAGF